MPDEPKNAAYCANHKHDMECIGDLVFQCRKCGEMQFGCPHDQATIENGIFFCATCGMKLDPIFETSAKALLLDEEYTVTGDWLDRELTEREFISNLDDSIRESLEARETEKKRIAKSTGKTQRIIDFEETARLMGADLMVTGQDDSFPEMITTFMLMRHCRHDWQIIDQEGHMHCQKCGLDALCFHNCGIHVEPPEGHCYCQRCGHYLGRCH